MTAGWPGRQYHTGVVKPSSLPLFSPNYSHSLSITPHNSGKLSNGRNNSNFNLSVPVVSTKKMLSRALRLRLPRFLVGSAGEEEHGRHRGRGWDRDLAPGDGRGTGWMLGASPAGTTGAPRRQLGWHWGGSRWGQPLVPCTGDLVSSVGRSRAGQGTLTAGAVLSSQLNRTEMGISFLVKTCFPSWELACRKGNSELPRNALAF